MNEHHALAITSVLIGAGLNGIIYLFLRLKEAALWSIFLVLVGIFIAVTI